MEISNSNTTIDLEELKKIPMFFIVGRPRSGTTLLRTLFDAHHNVKVPPECAFILMLEFKFGKIKEWTREILIDFYNQLLKQKGFKRWPLKHGRLLENLLKMVGNYSYGEICRVVYFSYDSMYKTEKLLMLGDKNPVYTIYTNKLIHIFPDAKFIHIVRDYRDNFVSLKRVKMDLPFISYAVSKWVHFIEKYNEVALKYPGKFILFKYEDLIFNSEKSMTKIFDFVGLDFKKEVFEFHLKKGELSKLFPEKSLENHTSLMASINGESVGVWKSQLSERQTLIADYCSGKFGSDLGYHSSKESFSLKVKVSSLPGKLLSNAYYFMMIFIMTKPYQALRSFIFDRMFEIKKLIKK